MKFPMNRTARFSLLPAMLISLAAPTLPQSVFADDEDTGEVSGTALRDRGQPYEYDPGPPKSSRWASLFAATPNYRKIGIEVLGGTPNRDEKYRWTFGPMFYRGRLTPNSVKVFVIGQEGAQDESVSNRSFTGGTGAKMQAFLKHLGITQSYLFMNTFVYTINGQYTSFEDDRDAIREHTNSVLPGVCSGATPAPLCWLAQAEGSPVVKHRHEMFDYMLEQNKNTLALVIAVGGAAQDSLRAWIRHKGGECRSIGTSCDATVLGRKVRVLSVPHPGAASPRNGGDAAGAALRKAFADAAKKVAEWARTDGWLPADTGARRDLSKPYNYASSAIPYRDFAFGTMWRLGRGGTSSNRKDDQKSIQVFSADGCYNADCGTPEAPQRVPLSYAAVRDATTSIPEMPAGDLEWEAPRKNATEYDEGPGKFAKVLMGGERGFAYPKFETLGVTQHESFGTTQVYRGRLDKARLLVVADQESVDDIFTGRALTGAGGQRLQTFLNQAGLSASYAILRTLPVDTSDLSEEKVRDIALNAQVKKVRQEIVKRVLAEGKTEAVLAVGPVAQAAVDALELGSVRVVKMSAPGASGFESSWSGALKELKDAGLRADSGMTARTSYSDKLTSIARLDLPVQTKGWVGTGGNRAVRPTNRDTRALDGNYYKIFMPEWVFRLAPKALSSAERSAIAGAIRE